MRRLLLFSSMLLLVLGLFAVPTTTAEAQGVIGTVVNARHLNVRYGPSVQFGILAVVNRGETLYVVGRNAAGSWINVSLGQYSGWVSSAYLWLNVPLYSLPITDGGYYPPPPVYTPPPPVYYPPPVYGQRTYVVQFGDNLFRIARRFGVDVYTLAQVNGIYDLNRVYAGQVLIIP
jgi:hypothetical protein